MRVPVYVQQARLDGGPVAPLLSPEVAGVAGQGLQRAGAQGLRLAAQLGEAEDAAWITSTTAAARREWSERLSRAQEGAGEGAPGFTPAIMQEYEAWQVQTLAGAPSARARSEAAGRLDGLKTGLFEDSLRFETQARVAKRGADFGLSVQALQAAAYGGADPGALMAQFNDDLAMAGGTWMPPGMISEWRLRGPALLAESYALGQIERDPAGVAGALGVSGTYAAGVVAGSVEELWPLVEQRESGGRQAAVSPKGAVGVAQVMPATGPEAARLAGLAWDEERFRNDAEYNRALGKAYLGEQLRRYGGNAALALAAYNAGPGRVDGWLKAFGDPRKGEISTGEWIVAIPFAETQSYVTAILSGAGAGLPSGPPPAWVAALPPDRRVALAGRAEAEAKRRALGGEAERAAWRSRVGDHLASVRQTGVGLPDVTPEAVGRALGPEAGAAFQAAATEAATAYATLQQVQWLAPAQALPIIEALRPEPGAEGFERQAKLHQEVAQGYAQARKAFEADPAAYVAGLPGVTDRVSSFVAQQFLGAAPGTEWVLPKAAAGEVVGRLQAMPPEQAADAMEALAQQYGADWPHVFRDLSRSGLPDGFRVLATMDGPEQATARLQLARALQTGQAELRKLLPGAAVTAITTALDEEMAAFLTTLGPASDGNALGQAYRAAAELLALQLARTLQPEEAAAAATEALLGRWDLVQSDGVNARAPRGLGEVAATYGERLLGALSPEELADPGGVSPETLALTPEERRRQLLPALRAQGVWITAPDGAGWVLTGPDGQVVRRSDGAPIAFRFDDGELAAAERDRQVPPAARTWEEHQKAWRNLLGGGAP